MEKLTIEHLAPYLPYGLKGKIKSFESELNADIVTDVSFEHGLVCLMNTGTFEISLFKPILRPLSDLTQDDVGLLCEYSDLEDVLYSRKPSSLYFINTQEKTYLEDYVNSLNYLFKNHFDVFGLIDKELAIDINTI